MPALHDRREAGGQGLRRYVTILRGLILSLMSRPSGLTLETMENLGISQDKYDIWLNFEVAKYSILLDCPKCRQSVLVDKDDHASASILICPVPKCGHMWCKTCYQPVESEFEEDHSCDGSKELEKLMKAQGWKNCPVSQYRPLVPRSRAYQVARTSRAAKRLQRELMAAIT